MRNVDGVVRRCWTTPKALILATISFTFAGVEVRRTLGGRIQIVLGLRPGLGWLEPSLMILTVKIVGDGSNQTETGAQTKPYLNSTSKGSPNSVPRR